MYFMTARHVATDNALKYNKNFYITFRTRKINLEINQSAINVKIISQLFRKT